MAALVDAAPPGRPGRVDCALAVLMSLLIVVPADAAGIYLQRGSRGTNVKTLEPGCTPWACCPGPPWTAGTATPRGWQSRSSSAHASSGSPATRTPRPGTGSPRRTAWPSRRAGSSAGADVVRPTLGPARGDCAPRRQRRAAREHPGGVPERGGGRRRRGRVRRALDVGPSPGGAARPDSRPHHELHRRGVPSSPSRRCAPAGPTAMGSPCRRSKRCWTTSRRSTSTSSRRSRNTGSTWTTSEVAELVAAVKDRQLTARTFVQSFKPRVFALVNAAAAGPDHGLPGAQRHSRDRAGGARR